ncbi:hypothetical protein PINS_up000433 [Pythium insidiosum]|nr:hypothetical protein PINS_up000433 [Pythium insidiosum]
MPERAKALSALVSRIEEGTADGEQVSISTTDSGSTSETKRELLRMAVAGRKAQINFFGVDVCFELVVELAKILGPVLFPPKAFEGIMSEQKMKKIHQHGKEKELDIWKTFAAHIRHIHGAKLLPVNSIVDVFANAFLSHDPDNQRSLRKLRELLHSLCGTTDSSPSKKNAGAVSSTKPSTASREAETSNEPTHASGRPVTAQVPSLLQTAFLGQSTASPKPKTFGISTSGLKKKASSSDVLMSMGSSPEKLSQKVLRGAKLGDYSEFEEEEVDLDRLIGNRASASAMGAKGDTGASSSSISRSRTAPSARAGSARDTEREDFDVDF